MAAKEKVNPFRVSLQLKSAVVLTFVVLTAIAAGGWSYFNRVQDLMRSEDNRRAMRIAQALGLAAQDNLTQQRHEPLQNLVSEYLRNDSIRFVAILDSDGHVTASASRETTSNRYASLLRLPVSVSMMRRAAPGVLSLARPIILQDAGQDTNRLAGSVRLVLDTTATAAALRDVRHHMMVIAVILVACALPFGYILVWHVVGQPLGELVRATRQLGRGDFAARAQLTRRDEIGELAGSFNMMATEVSRMRDELVDANERLEQKVADRTQELELANQRLREEMAEKEDFLRAVSHDLNAPLRNIAGMTSILLMNPRDELPDDAVARLQRIQANVEVETSLIAELLELSRIRTRPQRRDVVDMRELIGGVVETLDFELKQRGIAVDVTSHMPYLYVEKARMRQVFQNLIDNAIKYMHRDSGGRIVIEHELADEQGLR